ncbi:MAG: hypothetical protein GY696_06585, partial [Gammaproteobacteria bacterium]|nr:hypothetical protein [Gammaproteobacteria bacterium]
MVFDNYIFQKNQALAAANANAIPLTDEQQNRLLFSLLGTEGQRQFSGTPQCDNFTRAHTVVVGVAQQLFQPRVNVVAANVNFRNRKQHPGEKVRDYITELRLLAADCQFQDENREIAIQLCVGCHSQQTQEKLLALRNLDYDPILQLMQADEEAVISAKEMRETLKVGFVDKKRKSPRIRGPPSKPEKPKTCSHCGKSGHQPNDDSCPARGHKCICGKSGHFEAVCWVLHPELAPNGFRPKKRQPVNRIDEVQRPFPRLPIRAVQMTDDEEFRCDILVQNEKNQRVSINFEAGTGSKPTVIPHGIFLSKFGKHSLRSPDAILTNYDGSEIQVAGYFWANLYFDTRHFRDKIY